MTSVATPVGVNGNRFFSRGLHNENDIPRTLLNLGYIIVNVLKPILMGGGGGGVTWYSENGGQS